MRLEEDALHTVFNTGGLTCLLHTVDGKNYHTASALRHAVLLTGFLLYIFGREFRCMRRHETSVLFACFGNIYDTMNNEAGEGRVSVSIYMDW